MKIKFDDNFLHLINDQVKYFARDKPIAAKKFKNYLLASFRKDLKYPFNYKKSIYFDNFLIQNYVFNGYTSIYEIRGN